MDNTERDKFLTERMGECYHDWVDLHKCDTIHDYDYNVYLYKCSICGEEGQEHEYGGSCFDEMNNFSTPDGFFKLWNWSQEQDWFDYFATATTALGYDTIARYMVNPDRFADAVYAFLKG